jgi:hypothetical protein
VEVCVPDIRLLLDLSTAHLPEHLGCGGLDTAPGVVAHRTECGWLLWVPDDPDESATAILDTVPGVVLAIQRYARRHGCDYVLFDADADRVDDLPTWDW